MNIDKMNDTTLAEEKENLKINGIIIITFVQV